MALARAAGLYRSKLGFGPVICGFLVGQAACVYSLTGRPGQVFGGSVRC